MPIPSHMNELYHPPQMPKSGIWPTDIWCSLRKAKTSMTRWVPTCTTQLDVCSPGHDHKVESVKNDCRLARTECCSLFLGAHGPSASAPNHPKSNEDSEAGSESTLVHRRTTLGDLMHQDMWGAMDSDFPGEVIQNSRSLLHLRSLVKPVIPPLSSVSSRCGPAFAKSQPS